jgi:hypothetical protein
LFIFNKLKYILEDGAIWEHSGNAVAADHAGLVEKTGPGTLVRSSVN